MAKNRRIRWPRIGAIHLLLLLGLMTLCAPYLAPQDPYDLGALDLLDARLPPGGAAWSSQFTYWLGSDEQGRDMLSAILFGLRISLGVGFAGTLLGGVLGIAIGLCAAHWGGLRGQALMRLADLQLAFPALLLALALLASLGPGLGKVVLALAAVQWAYFARAARSAALVELQKDYIAAAHMAGVGPSRILLHHLLPNCLPTLRTLIPLQIAAAINLEATLSFLGLGAPVTEPSLGLLIANGFRYLLSGQYWISVFPGLALLVVVATINRIAGKDYSGS